jgi:hypothetical protein
VSAGRSRTWAACAALAILATGCAGDLGAESGLPACNARPVDPGGFEPVATEDIEGADRLGHRYAYRGPAGEEVAFYFGVNTGAGDGLPKVQQLPLTTLGAGQLSGQGTSWTFTWADQFPCDRMRVVGSGITQQRFITVLGLAGVIPAEEEEGEGGAPGGIPGAVEEEEELEGEIEGALPPGGPAIEWVAIYDSARDPADLERTRRRLMETAPGNLVIAAASCWKGLAQQLGVPRDAQVAGVVAITGNELAFVVERIELSFLFYGQLRSRCD